MENLKVVGWTDFESDYRTRTLNVQDLSNVIEIIKKEIIDKGYKFSGEEHQNSPYGVPVLSDGTCFRASMRCWGYIMAMAYSTEEKKYTYMDFYMSLGSKCVEPKDEPIDVEPAVLEQYIVGWTTQEDNEILIECLNSDMDFMTSDKVLRRLFSMLKEKREVENKMN